jgi:hypothetical protein
VVRWVPGRKIPPPQTRVESGEGGGSNEEILGVVDPFEASQGEHFVGSAMLKPCFSPFEPGICALATGDLR